MSNTTQTCSEDNCQNPVFENWVTCALHCEKSSYSEDWNIGLLLEFNNLLNNLLNNKSVNFISTHSDFAFFHGIYFPCRDSRDNFDYFKTLKKFNEIHFRNCIFYCSYMDLYPIEVFYDECCFMEDFYIYPTNMLENVLDSVFSICSFKKTISLNGANIDNKNTINNYFKFSLFSDCSFEGKLCVYNCNFDKDIFNNVEKRIELKNLFISDSIFNDKFSLNFFDIETLEVYNCKFISKLEIKESKIEVLLFENSNVERVSDFFESEIGNFKFNKCIFSDFIGFEKVEFGTKNADVISDSNMAIFQYVTFMSFVNFRNAIFYQGLDISNANFKEVPNFFNVQILSDNTNRETFRIIKDSFDKSGNHIEANNYFIQEMKAYKQEMKNDYKIKFGKHQKFIIYANEEISSFGQSYIKPLIILFLSSIIYWSIKTIHKIVFIKGKFDLIFPLNKFSDFLNDLAKNFFPFSSFIEKHQGLEFVSLLFYIWFSILIWQIVVAVKRHTIR